MTFIGRFFLLVLVLGFIELYLLVNVAAALGFWPTLGFCVFTGIVGGSLVRAQGLATITAIQRQAQQGQLPAAEIVSGVVLLIVGALLIVPGFITDAIGFLLLIPPLRLAAAGKLAQRFEGRFQPMGGAGFGPGPFGPGPFVDPEGDPAQRADEQRHKARGKVIDIEPD